MSRKKSELGVREGVVFDLVGRVYEASVDDGAWESFLDLLAATLRSQTASFFVQDLEGRMGTVGAAVGLDPEHLRLYEERFARRNILMERAAPRLASGYLATETVVPAEEFLASDYYNDYFRVMGIRHTIGACVFRERSLSSMLTLLRRPEEGAYTDAELALCRLLLPHLQRAIAVQRKLEGTRLGHEAALAALDRLRTGVVLLDRQRRVLFVNRAAARVLDRRDGLCVERGRLAPRSPRDRARLEILLALASAPSRRGSVARGGALRLERAGDRRPLALLVTPLGEVASARRWVDGTVPEVALFVSDPEERIEAPEEHLVRLYRLTPAEARVAAELLAEKSPREAAEALGVSYETTRLHVKRILAKAGVRRQSELVRLLLGPLQIVADPDRPPASARPAD